MTTLAWYTATSNDASGYGAVSVRLHAAVRRAGATILRSDAFGWETLVAVTPPRAHLVGPSGVRRDVVVHTMYEARRVPPAWVAILNRCGGVWVPAQHSADLFRTCGVQVPIGVSGYGVDPAFTYVERPVRDTPFHVLAISDTLVSRKNVLRSVEAFVAADLPHAVMTVKIADPQITRHDVRVEGVVDPRITLINQRMTQPDFVGLMHAADVGISLSGGEGFGLLPLQQMATGLPMIMTINTGMAAYAQPDAVFAVPSRGTTLSPSIAAQFGAAYAEIECPDHDAAVDALRFAYANREACAQRGQRGYATTRMWTWDQAGVDALALLARLA